MLPRPLPLEAEQAFGMNSFLTDTPGIGGRLRSDSEDFQVIELGAGPPAGDGAFTAVRIRLRNWETNRFVSRAAREVGIKPGHVGFAGMKDKRAVTEQWFSFRCPADRLSALEGLQDVTIVGESYRARDRWYPGAHDGNRFVLRVRDHNGDRESVARAIEQIAAAQGVPNFFGPQRFGAAVRPITARVGAAIVAGDLEEAVRLYIGHPFLNEHEDAQAARQIWEDTHDPAATYAAYPRRLDHERRILERLVEKPDNWRSALMALPKNLLQLFVHAHQSLLFNRIVSARVDAGFGLATAQIGDRVMATTEDGTRTVPVLEANQARVQLELDKGRAVLTAPLLGLDVPLADGAPGRIERDVLDQVGAKPRDFRCRELPQVASTGRRRGILQPVGDLQCDWVDGDPIVSFSLGRGAYATVVMREIMKADVFAY